ncbi:MAG: hypothetical protein HYY01_13440 [Chloroflexi bacterium]|nr:hypothetical protein [Chloroflexota bacterium]
MKLEGAFEVATPASRLWDFLWDVEALGACLPGCEGVQRADHKTFVGAVKARVGPVQATFQGKAAITESAPPNRIVLKAEGQDSRTASRVRATIELSLRALDASHTRAGYQADVAIVGRLGQFGDGIIRETAGLLLEEFAANVRAWLEGGEGPPPGAGEVNMLKLFRRAIARWLTGGVGRWWSRLRGRPPVPPRPWLGSGSTSLKEGRLVGLP